MSLPDYAERVIVEVGILGTIATTADPRTPIVPYNGELDGSGIFVTSVYNSCYAHVIFEWPTPP